MKHVETRSSGPGFSDDEIVDVLSDKDDWRIQSVPISR